jgi:hypothetical protein
MPIFFPADGTKRLSVLCAAASLVVVRSASPSPNTHPGAYGVLHLVRGTTSSGRVLGASRSIRS